MAASLTLDPFKGIKTTDNLYVNERLGLHAHLPLDWEFSSIADFAALRERQVLLDMLEWEDEPHPLKDPDNLPVFLFEHPKYRRGHFAPAILLYDETLDHTPPADQRIAHMNMLDAFSDVYRQLVVKSDAEYIDLDGARGTRTIWSYLHEIDSGEEFDLTVTSLLVFRPPRVHTFYLVDSRDKPRIEQNTWEAFCNSIKYDEV